MLQTDFKEFLELLNEYNVRYLVVGGYALNLYVTKPRNTGDLDIWIEISAENALNMKKAVEHFCGVNDIDETVFMNENLRAPIGEPPLCIDILMKVDGLEFQKCYKQKNVISWHQIDIPFLTKSDLITTKKFVNRPQDIADVAALEKAPN